MKSIFVFFLIILLSKNLWSQAQEESRFAFKGNFVISILGGGAEIIGDNGTNVYPVINSILGYHITDRFSIVADAIFYTSGPGKMESGKTDFEFNRAGHYGMAGRYYTKRNLKCGTGTLQTGVYLFDTGEDQLTLNWIFTPGWLYPLDKKERFFVEMAFDFQMNRVIKGESFLMTAKLGLSYHF